MRRRLLHDLAYFQLLPFLYDVLHYFVRRLEGAQLPQLPYFQETSLYHYVVPSEDLNVASFLGRFVDRAVEQQVGMQVHFGFDLLLEAA